MKNKIISDAGSTKQNMFVGGNDIALYSQGGSHKALIKRDVRHFGIDIKRPIFDSLQV